MRLLLNIILLMMASLKVPSEATIKRVIEGTTAALSDRLYECKETKKYLPKICAVCDRMATIHNPTQKLQIDKFIGYCEKANAHKEAASFLILRVSLISIITTIPGFLTICSLPGLSLTRMLSAKTRFLFALNVW